MTAIAARQVGDSGSVLSFEPMPETRLRLSETVSLNGLTNVAVSSSAIVDSSGTRMLRPPGQEVRGSEESERPKFTTMWTLVDAHGAQGAIPVECHSLDELALTSPTPDLLKIDAEGGEVEVLAGGTELLAKRRTQVIIELSNAEPLARVKTLLPDFHFEHIGANHWLLR